MSSDIYPAYPCGHESPFTFRALCRMQTNFFWCCTLSLCYYLWRSNASEFADSAFQPGNSKSKFSQVSWPFPMDFSPSSGVKVKGHCTGCKRTRNWLGNCLKSKFHHSEIIGNEYKSLMSLFLDLSWLRIPGRQCYTERRHNIHNTRKLSSEDDRASGRWSSGSGIF